MRSGSSGARSRCAAIAHRQVEGAEVACAPTAVPALFTDVLLLGKEAP
jgi:hypothetical protein